MNLNTHMLSNTLFSNPWQLWCSPKQVEDAQTIHEANLFDDDMSSISNPGNHLNDAIAPTESQMDIVPPATYAQPGVPSHHGTLEPDYMSTSAGTSKHVQQDIPMNLGTEGSVCVVLSQSSKCHFWEADFSWSLQQGLYEKEEALNKLCKQKNDAVAGLQSLLKQREKQQIQSGQEQTAWQYEKQFDELQMQFEFNMQSQIDKLQVTRMTEIKTHVQEEAEKERELTNIEQCYMQLKKPDKGTESGSTLSEGHEEETRGKAAPGTLDDQPDPPPVSAMVEAITKSVETTLRTILESRNHFSAEVQCLFKEKLGIVQDINFITHISADAADVYAYEHKDGPGPDMDKIAFDLVQNHSSPWNTFILGFLLHKFQLCCNCESWPIRKDDDYIQEILQERYKWL
ncbi:hypothetical protein EDC04DRAFT_2611546 [Pisolithus marmoratus]|nr:hypothetical protein EDC04DRAFT_2611546 [Pisolithus marmoratus]